MYHVETEPNLCKQHQHLAASVITDDETADEDVQQNWYFWRKHSATRNDHYGSESITTVYAVKTAIGQRYTGWSALAFKTRVRFAVGCIAVL